MRVRVGVGRPDSSDPEIVSAYVLGRFREGEEQVEELIERACEQVEARRAGRRASRGRGAAGEGLPPMAPAAPSSAPAAGADRAGRLGAGAGARGRSRVRVPVAAALPDRGAGGASRAPRARARRSWWWATIAQRAIWPPTCAPGLRRGGCATTRLEGWPMSPISRRRRTSSACAWPRWTPCSERRTRPALRWISRSWWSARWRCRRRCPTPSFARTRSALRVGELLDLEECAAELVARGL